jgi:tripartite-type tricarboxylate transporter receptor subunit TctC
VRQFTIETIKPPAKIAPAGLPQSLCRHYTVASSEPVAIWEETTMAGRRTVLLRALLGRPRLTLPGFPPLLTAVCALAPAMVCAQSLVSLVPGRPVLIVVPNAAAGPSDYLARVLAPKLGEAVHQNVIVDNRPSANGVTAGEIVARATPDGSMIAIGNTGTHAINATLYRKLSYDPVRAFAPIINVISTGLVLAANPRFAPESIRDIIAYAKKNPGGVNVAIAGATGEIATNAIKSMAQIDLNKIPYKGGAPAVISVIAGETHFVLTPYAGVSAQVEAGKLKILGVTGLKRDPLLPDTPTLSESGLDGYDISMWYGVFAPARTPPAVVRAYNREIARIANEPELKSRFLSQGYEVVTGSPEQFAAQVKRDAEKYRKIILDAGMQQDL